MNASRKRMLRQAEKAAAALARADQAPRIAELERSQGCTAAYRALRGLTPADANNAASGAAATPAKRPDLRIVTSLTKETVH